MSIEHLASQYSNIVFFDSECLLCNTFVRRVLRRDKKKSFVFVGLQTPWAQQFLGAKGVNIQLDTVYFYSEAKLYSHSTAVLKIHQKLGYPSALLYWLIVVPRFLRDGVYRLVSQNRTKLGAHQCAVLSKEERERIIIA